MASEEINKVKELTEQWLEWDENATSKQEIESLKAKEDWSKLGTIMLKRLEFGTAGIRGRMGPGFGQMNDLVIIQVTQGLKNYLLRSQKGVKEKGVVYGFDGRYNSERWAKLAAGVFLRENIPVYLFKTTTPTPFIPFAIRKLGLSAGVMVTASHNPKWDNGYKVYWDNGSQILSPHDKEIQKEILNSLKPESGAFQVPDESNPLLSDPMNLVNDPYFKVIQDNVYNLEMNRKLSIPIVYTGMHGVGYPYVYQSWTKAGFKADLLHSVKEQQEADPEFSTVDFPNPEEGATALDLSFRTANEVGARYILANDPDADRLGVAQKIDDKWKVLSGNEIGGLFGWWHLKTFREKNPDVDPKDIYMLASTVSSKILNTLTQKIGANFIETLTGFKHMGNRAHTLIGEGKHVLFAFEEAIGFMCGSAVLDKDGVSAVAKISEMIAYLEEKNLSLTDQLNEIYLEYGYHYTLNSYYLCYDPKLTDNIFTRIRSFKDQPNTYPDSLGGVVIKNIRDLTTGYDSSTSDNKATLPTSKSSHMITFWLENGIVITLRTSGTEPKIKYYTEYCAKAGVPKSEWKFLEAELSRIVDDTIKTLLQPHINDIKPKPN